MFDFNKTVAVGFWRLLWVKIFGKKSVIVNYNFRITAYSYKGCVYVTDMTPLDVREPS